MARFNNTRFDKVGNVFGYGGHMMGYLYTDNRHVQAVILNSPITLEALDLVTSALSKFKRIEMSHAEFIEELEGILQDYDDAT
jgi:hypothetical protein